MHYESGCMFIHKTNKPVAATFAGYRLFQVYKETVFKFFGSSASRDQAQLPLAVYFTNIFDARRMPESQKLIDISTHRLMENYLGSEEQWGLSGYPMEETEQQLRFIKSRRNKHADKIPFKLPEKITVFVNQPEAFLTMEGRKTAAFSHFGDFIRSCQTN